MPVAGLLLLDATHWLFNGMTAQLPGMLAEKKRLQEALPWVRWQSCVQLGPTRLSAVVFVCGICQAHSFPQGAAYNHALSICLLIRFCLFFFWPCSIFVVTAWKKLEWMCSLCIVSSKSFLFQCSYYSLSPPCSLFWGFDIIQARLSQLFSMMIRCA